MFQKLYQLLLKWLRASPVAEVAPQEWISKIISDCAAQELKVNEFVRMNGVTGMHGVVKLSGNSIPCFQYTVFDREIMEFIRVKGYLSLPDKINFDHEVIPTGDGLPETLPPLKDAYTEPFYLLMRHLYVYFPFPMPDKNPGEVMSIVGESV